MAEQYVPNLPPELIDALNLVADNAAEKIYQRLILESRDLFGPEQTVADSTKLWLAYLISLRLTSLIQKKIKESTPT